MKKTLLILIFISVLYIGLAATKNDSQISLKQATANTNNPKITLETNFGNIVIELNVEKAPITANNFIKYVKNGFYDNTVFHRVIKGFMIQGGGFEIGLKQKKTDSPIKNEADNGLLNNKYTIAMARTTDPHSASSQFFINTSNNYPLNHTDKSERGWGYCVFGKVIKGMEVVDKIESQQTVPRGRHGNVPAFSIIVKKAKIL
ncbi:MAG: peptidyl-prolyl cis-trans isomerase [Desulfobacterales bacterium]|nr:peptidyl-prolyl cis-trans isomerase [Desulfobacterales bacterium]MCP4162541.1 peptidyl-prolyl cis-trans isomerase [Deltaproteobacteria bacterium]